MARKLGQAEISAIIKDYTHDLLTSTYDFMLAAVYYQFDMGEVMKSDLSIINIKTLKRVVDRLSSNNLIVENADKVAGFDVTNKGKEKLESILTQYKEDRPWSGSLYAVTYDVPTSNNVLRNKLRFRLLEHKCSLFQNSVWICGYDPREFLDAFIYEHKALNDHILITKTIDNHKEVARKTFEIDKIANRYENFITLSQSEFMTREETIFAYLSILKDDPQLPFQILSDDWPGIKANEIYSQIVNR